jgi:S1-C subfamily serine protease
MGVRYDEVDVSRDAVAAAELVRRSGQRGVPVITVDDQVVVGFDPKRLEMLLSKASQKHPSVGMAIADASKIAVKSGALPIFGAYVGKVAQGSPAERAGMRQGDIITEANFQPVTRAADLEKVLNGLTAGSRLVLSVSRGDHSVRVQISL